MSLSKPVFLAGQVLRQETLDGLAGDASTTEEQRVEWAGQGKQLDLFGAVAYALERLTAELAELEPAATVADADA